MAKLYGIEFFPNLEFLNCHPCFSISFLQSTFHNRNFPPLKRACMRSPVVSSVHFTRIDSNDHWTKVHFYRLKQTSGFVTRRKALTEQLARICYFLAICMEEVVEHEGNNCQVQRQGA
jgi:hypothetical protein